MDLQVRLRTLTLALERLMSNFRSNQWELRTVSAGSNARWRPSIAISTRHHPEEEPLWRVKSTVAVQPSISRTWLAVTTRRVAYHAEEPSPIPKLSRIRLRGNLTVAQDVL